MRINPNFVQYVSENVIVFVSGCNIILYNLETKEQKFIPTKSTQRFITYLSLGNMKTQKPNETFMNGTKSKINYTINTTHSFNLKDILICIGEYSNKEELFYITVIKPGSNIQYTIKSNEQKWKVNYQSEQTIKKYQHRYQK